jgi:hypothetical protein
MIAGTHPRPADFGLLAFFDLAVDNRGLFGRALLAIEFSL